MKKLSIIIFILLLTINARSQSPMTVGTFPGDVLGLGLNESSNYSPTGIWDFSGADYTSFGDSVNVDGMIVYSSDNDVYIKFSSNRIQFNTRDGVKLDLQGYGVALGGNFLDLSSSMTGADAFSGTATADTILNGQFDSGDYYWINATGASISGNDIFSVEAKTDTVIFHRLASGTADLPYNWWRTK